MDIEQVRQLVELMAANDISRLEVHEADTHIILRRGQPVVVGAAMAPAALPSAGAAAVAAPSAPAAGPAAAEAPASGGGEAAIRSPMVGTFYVAPDPDSPPFVKPGDTVGPESVVCLIEAMKVFNEIKSEVSGRIVRPLVKNGEAVEFDQPLFAIVPA